MVLGAKVQHSPEIAIYFALACFCIAFPATAQDKPLADEKLLAATVGDEPIYVGDARRALKAIVGHREINPAALPTLKARALEEIVSRRLILAYARRTASGATDEQVDATVKELTSKLSAQGRSLGDLSPKGEITEDDLRRQVFWQLTWQKYIGRYVTEKRLESYFKAHHRDFDGTEVSVSHILLSPAEDDRADTWGKLIAQAKSIREAIISKKTTFAEAAKRHSNSPTAATGGKLGFIARQGAMAESFARAAFELQPGEVSRPVRTRFGVHLIRCEEIKPGQKKWTDIRDELETPLARELMKKIADLQRKHTEVKYTNNWPHVAPEESRK